MPRTQGARLAEAAKPKRSERETVVTLRLPRELHERLKGEADAGGRGFAAELRQRLEASFTAGTSASGDPETRRLLDGIGAMADFIASVPAPVWQTLGATPEGPWHKSQKAFSAFEIAVVRLLSAFGPGEPKEPINETWKALSAMALIDGLKKAGVSYRMEFDLPEDKP